MKNGQNIREMQVYKLFKSDDWIKIAPDANETAGVSDFLFINDGKTCFVEVKMTEKIAKASISQLFLTFQPNQLDFFARMSEKGCGCYAIFISKFVEDNFLCRIGAYKAGEIRELTLAPFFFDISAISNLIGNHQGQV